MTTFNWEEIKRDDGLVELRCYHTQHNSNFNTTRRIMSCFYAEPEDVVEAKKSFEENRKCVVEGGAWRAIEGAVWTL